MLDWYLKGLIPGAILSSVAIYYYNTTLCFDDEPMTIPTKILSWMFFTAVWPLTAIAAIVLFVPELSYIIKEKMRHERG